MHRFSSYRITLRTLVLNLKNSLFINEIEINVVNGLIKMLVESLQKSVECIAADIIIENSTNILWNISFHVWCVNRNSLSLDLKTQTNLSSENEIHSEYYFSLSFVEFLVYSKWWHEQNIK